MLFIYWLGHMEQREKGTLLNKISSRNIGGRRRKERMRKTGLEEVEEDLKGMGIRIWRRKIQDRSEWGNNSEVTIM